MPAKKVLKRPLAARPIKEKADENPVETNMKFEKRCQDHLFSQLELDTFFSYCNICGRLQSIRDLDFKVVQPNMIEKICLRCHG